MWKYNNTDTLYHHGVLGQKWGVRRVRSAVTNAKARRAVKKSMKAQAKEDARKAASAKKPAADDSKRNAYKTMSDEELAYRVRRLQNEVSYKIAYEKLNPKKVSLGERFVNDAKNMAYTYTMNTLNTVATNALNKQLNKIMNQSKTGKTVSSAKTMASASKEAGQDFANNMKSVMNEAKNQSVRNESTVNYPALQDPKRRR